MRKIWADSLTGLCILYMIAMHVSIAQAIGVQIYLGTAMFFFMAWFFFKSGLFFSPKPTKELILKDTKRLLVPYVVFGCIGFIIYVVSHDTSFSREFISSCKRIVSTGGITGNLPLWFLFVLFIVRQLHNMLCVKFGVNIKVLLSEIVLCFTMSMLLYTYDLNIIRWVPNVFLGMAFFSFGFFHKVIKKEMQFKHKYMLILIYICSLFTLPSSNFAANTVEGHPIFYVLWFLFSIVAIYIYIMLFSKFQFLNIKPLVCLGKSSMTYYVCHWPILFMMIEVFKKTLSGYTLFFVVLVMTMVVCYMIDIFLSSSKMKFILGK